MATANSEVILEVKHSSNVRDLRAGLLSLAYALIESDQVRPGPSHEGAPARALYALIDSRLVESRLQAELEMFRSLIGHDLGSRIFAALLSNDGGIRGDMPPAPTDFVERLSRLAREERSGKRPNARASRALVKAILLEASLADPNYADGLPRSLADLQRLSGASYPTVAVAVRELVAARALVSEKAPLRLIAPGPDVWRAVAAGVAAERRTARFVDPSRQAHAEGLLSMLMKLRERLLSARGGRDLALSIGVSGVVGAKMRYPGLDISRPLRLDLCVYDGDDSFVRELDPGLVASTSPKSSPVLVLHHTRDVRARCNAVDARHGNVMASGEVIGGLRLSSVVDCYTDLLDMGYAGEAREFALAMTRQEK